MNLVILLTLAIRLIVCLSPRISHATIVEIWRVFGTLRLLMDFKTGNFRRTDLLDVFAATTQQTRVKAFVTSCTRLKLIELRTSNSSSRCIGRLRGVLLLGNTTLVSVCIGGCTLDSCGQCGATLIFEILYLNLLLQTLLFYVRHDSWRILDCLLRNLTGVSTVRQAGARVGLHVRCRSWLGLENAANFLFVHRICSFDARYTPMLSCCTTRIRLILRYMTWRGFNI